MHPVQWCPATVSGGELQSVHVEKLLPSQEDRKCMGSGKRKLLGQ